MDDVIDKDMMLALRPRSYGSATELKSIMLTPPLSDKLFIDSLRLEYFSRFFSRFDLSHKEKYRHFIFNVPQFNWKILTKLETAKFTSKWVPCILFGLAFVLWPNVVAPTLSAVWFFFSQRTIQRADRMLEYQMNGRNTGTLHWLDLNFASSWNGEPTVSPSILSHQILLV